MIHLCRFCLLLTVLFSCTASAVVDLYEFDTEVQRQRYQNFVAELRCPKCQNQNLSGSNSPIAGDLRRQVHRLIMSGASDDDITEFMVERYGEFVLYKTRAQGAALVLWWAPVGLLLLGLVVLFWLLRARRTSPSNVSEVPTTEALSAAEQSQLEELLTRGRESDSDPERRL